MRSSLFAPVFIATAALSGCATLDPVTGSTDPGFGEAVKYDMALQTIDPDPRYPADAAQPGENGEKGAKAVERYRKDQVNARHKSEAGTTSTGGSSGGPG